MSRFAKIPIINADHKAQVVYIAKDVVSEIYATPKSASGVQTAINGKHGRTWWCTLSVEEVLRELDGDMVDEVLSRHREDIS